MKIGFSFPGGVDAGRNIGVFRANVSAIREPPESVWRRLVISVLVVSLPGQRVLVSGPEKLVCVGNW